MNFKENILEKINNNNGYISTKELKAMNINRFYLSALEKEGQIERIKRGLYRKTDYIVENEFFEISKIIPNGVICLESAAEYHGLITTIPYEYNIAIQRDNKIILPDYPPIKIIYFSKFNYELGITFLKKEDSIIKIYDLEKTVCDITRYRNKIGKNIYTEVLKEYLKNKDKNINKLLEYGKITRVYNILKESLEVLL